MRVSLPFMLALSLALHAGVVGGFALSHRHTITAPIQPPSSSEVPAMILLSSEETPDMGKLSTARTAPAQPVVASAPIALPSPHQVPTKAPAKSTPIRPASFALEANPNAHIRALPPEAVLSPSPAPRLNGRDGVVFLLDVSGSMYEKYAGSTRLAFAREILSNRIRALKDGTPFAITVYSQTARNSGPLVAASNATREAAVHFIKEDIDCGGGTDLPSGLASAMKLETGALVLVSDGELNTMLPVLMEKARAILNPDQHGPALSVVAISPRPEGQDASLLQSLAHLTGGSYVAVQHEEPAAPLLTSAKTE